MSPQGYWILGSKAGSGTLWLYKVLLQNLLNFLLGTCENNYRVVVRRHRESGSSLRKQKQMKCGPLGKLHCAHGWEQVSVLNWLFCSHCTADSNCCPDANCLYCPGSTGCCKVLASCSSSLWDVTKLHELPHTSQITLIYLCVCVAIRLLYQKILKVLLQLFLACFLLLINVSGINLSSWLFLEAPGFCLMIWCYPDVQNAWHGWEPCCSHPCTNIRQSQLWKAWQC